MNEEAMRQVLLDFVAMERDRQLGYASDELHTSPNKALIDALSVLCDSQEELDRIISPEDQRKLMVNFDEVEF